MTILNIKDQDFQEKVIDQSNIKPVLVDFWAPWCEPCKMIAPVLEELSTELEGKINILKINVDENPQNAGNFSIRSIPTMILFKEKKEIERIIGVISKEEIKNIILKHS